MNNLISTFGIRKLPPISLSHQAGWRSYICRIVQLLAIIGLSIVAQPLPAQPSQTAATTPEAAWASIQQLVQNLESAVQSKNLHGIHEPSMKIRAPIRTLKQQSTRLATEIGQKMGAALKQLDTAVTDLHSAADAGDQKGAESGVKEVEAALDQIKALDPDTTFKGIH